MQIAIVVARFIGCAFKAFKATQRLFDQKDEFFKLFPVEWK